MSRLVRVKRWTVEEVIESDAPPSELFELETAEPEADDGMGDLLLIGLIALGLWTASRPAPEATPPELAPAIEEEPAAVQEVGLTRRQRLRYLSS